MAKSDLPRHAIRVADLKGSRPTGFVLSPDASARAAIAEDLGILNVRKLRFEGDIAADGNQDWKLTGNLGATVVQPCVVTLDPVTTRIDVVVTRRFLADMPEVDPEEEEIEMFDDDSIEPLSNEIDAAAVMVEALALHLPLYPRKDGAELGAAVFTEPGQKPMLDEDAKPFAGLAGLRDKLTNDPSPDGEENSS